jgi:acyl carrier protein
VTYLLQHYLARSAECGTRKSALVMGEQRRIELGEVEAALNAVEQLKEVVGCPPTAWRGRRSAAERLPSYMLPSRWLTFEEMPKNVNGRIDRRRLKELFEEAKASGAERSSSLGASGMTPAAADISTRVARIFSDAVFVEVPTADTDLVASGLLDSLAFVELIHELEFGIELPLEGVDAESLRAIERIAALVHRLQPGSAPPGAATEHAPVQP